MVLEVQKIVLKSQFEMDQLSPLQKLTFSRNFSGHWEKWKQKLLLYIAATERTKKSKEIKSKILLSSEKMQRPKIKLLNFYKHLQISQILTKSINITNFKISSIPIHILKFSSSVNFVLATITSEVAKRMERSGHVSSNNILKRKFV